MAAPGVADVTLAKLKATDQMYREKERGRWRRRWKDKRRGKTCVRESKGETRERRETREEKKRGVCSPVTLVKGDC